MRTVSPDTISGTNKDEPHLWSHRRRPHKLDPRHIILRPFLRIRFELDRRIRRPDLWLLSRLLWGSGDRNERRLGQPDLHMSRIDDEMVLQLLARRKLVLAGRAGEFSGRMVFGAVLGEGVHRFVNTVTGRWAVILVPKGLAGGGRAY